MPFSYSPYPYGQSYPASAPVPAALAQQPYFQGQPAYAQGQPTYAQPVPFPPSGNSWQPKPAPVQQAAGPKSPGAPAARGKLDELPPYPPAAPPLPAPAPVAITLPPPSTLGITPATVAGTTGAAPREVDWNAARVRLDRLHADFSLKKVDGGYRMVITLPTAVPGQSHAVAVIADSEADAVATALERAEQWAKQ